MSRFWGFIQLLLAVAVVRAQDAAPAFPEERCFGFYSQGEYERAVDCINSVLYTGEIADTARLLKTYEHLGVSLAMLDKREPAKAAFKKMLALKSDIELNPNVYLPDIISQFQIAKFENRTQFRVLIVDTVPAYPAVYNYLPGGVPQFRNKQKVKGIALLSLQAAAIVLTAWGYHREQSFYSPDYGFREEDVPDAQRYDLLHKTALLTFIGSYLYGLVDGIIHKPITIKQ